MFFIQLTPLFQLFSIFDLLFQIKFILVCGVLSDVKIVREFSPVIYVVSLCSN